MATIETTEVIDELLKQARPGGSAHARLMKYRGMIERNVFIGPIATSYIQLLIDKLGNIECEKLNVIDDTCKRNGTTCQYSDLFSACPFYKKAKPTKSNKGQILGG